jgi:hypothetical protein
MTAFVPGLPLPAEYNPAFAGYIAKAQSFADPIRKLDQQLDEVMTVLRPLNATQRLRRYAPDKWSVQELVGHLIDAERIFAYRALRIGRGDSTPLAGFDENAYVPAAQAEKCDWSDLLTEFEHVRMSSVLLFQNLPREAWVRVGTSNGSSLSVRALAYIMIGHVAHHIDILRDRYL